MVDPVKISDIDILTHCDVSRMHRAFLMSRTMPKELKIILIIGYKNEEDKQFPLINKPGNIEIYFEPYDPKTIYPTNRFRNVAFSKSTRDFIFYLDVDFIFQFDFWDVFETDYLPQLSQGKVFCPIPLFNEFKPDYLSAFKEEDLLKLETEKTHEVILDNDFRLSADLFKFHDRWVDYPQKEKLRDMTPIMRLIRNGTILPEPWGILHKNDYLFADETFLGRVKDKQQFVCRLLDSGLRFYGMRDCVIYHLWHPDSRLDINREKENSINTLLFTKRYFNKYQNFYFLLQTEDLEDDLVNLLANFHNFKEFLRVPSGQTTNEVIEKLKLRKTIISNADFSPEYSVYGYKLIYVYSRKEFQDGHIHKRIGNKSNTGQQIFNLSYFSLELNPNAKNALKMIQDITGWPLKNSSENGYDSNLSTGPINQSMLIQ